jgi:hypothetical protein
MGRLQQFVRIAMKGRYLTWSRTTAAIKSLWQRPGVRWRIVLLALLIPLLCTIMYQRMVHLARLPFAPSGSR